LRVLFLTETFHPVLGGGEVHIRALAGALVRAGIPSTVVTRRLDAAWPEEETLDGIRVVRVPPTGAGRMGKYRMVRPAMAAVRRLAGEFDVLVVRGTRVLGAPGLWVGRSLKRPVVLQPDINGELSGEVYTWGKAWGARRTGAVLWATRMRNLWMRRASAFVAMSRAIEEEMGAAGVRAEKIHRIPHGVDLARFRPATPEERVRLRRRLCLPENATILTYTGRLLKGKGLEGLLTAFEDVATRWPLARLLLVGSGDGQTLSIERELMDRAAAGPAAGRVLFAGRVDNVADHLRASDVFVFPSVFEALGISLVEAAACGLACIGSRTGGIVDVLEHERTGLLHGPGDAAALGQAIERVLGDRRLAAALGRAARERAERDFDWTASVGRYQALFAALAGAA
jgi:glycosyltransferase involved in cell wall biosynthesis